MSFWPFGQNSNSASNLNKLLDLYYQKRTVEAHLQQVQQLQSKTLNNSHNSIDHKQDTSTDSISLQNGLEQLDQLPDIALDRQLVYELLDDPSFLQELNRQNNKLIDFICFGYINDDLPTSNTNDDTKDDIENDSIDDSSSVITKKNNFVSILEVLVDLIIGSVEWFERNENHLFKQDLGEKDLNPTYGQNNSNDESMDDNENYNNETYDDEQKQKTLQQQELENELLTTEFNRIHVASETLSCNIWLISETLVEEQSLLAKLWSFLDLQFSNASPTIQFFAKINEQLLESRPDQMLNFIRAQQNLVDQFIKHIDITIITDFLLRIITTDKPDIPTGILELLVEQNLITKLLDLILFDTDSSTQSSCGDLLKALISISANTSIDENTIGPNLLTKELVDEECVDKMTQIILNRGNGLSTIVGVIIEIIRKNNSDYDPINFLHATVESHPPNKRDPIYLGKMLKKLSQSLTNFSSILSDKELVTKRIATQINQEIEPLGFERFKICELIAELLHCSNIGLLNNHLTEKIIEERELFLQQQESNIASALNDEILDNSKANLSLNISNLNIGGTSEPSVAVSKVVTISPHITPSHDNKSGLEKGDLPLADSIISGDDGLLSSDENEKPEISKKEEIRSNPTVGDYFKIQLIDSGILEKIIKMFTRFPWNNFWHNVVFDIVQQIFNGRLDVGYNSFLILELFDSCDLTSLIIDSYNLCVETENNLNVRLGYMGHLVLIAEEVVKFSSIFQEQKLHDTDADELIYNKLIDNEWVNYVTNVLTETREQYNCVLGGIQTQDFQQSSFLNQNAIVLGNSEEEILGQQITDESGTNEPFISDENYLNEDKDVD